MLTSASSHCAVEVAQGSCGSSDLSS